MDNVITEWVMALLMSFVLFLLVENPCVRLAKELLPAYEEICHSNGVQQNTKKIE